METQRTPGGGLGTLEIQGDPGDHSDSGDLLSLELHGHKGPQGTRLTLGTQEPLKPLLTLDLLEVLGGRQGAAQSATSFGMTVTGTRVWSST